MLCWIVIPIKAAEACKTRLASALDEQSRRSLVAAMLDRTVRAAEGGAEGFPGQARILLAGPSRHHLPPDMPLLPDHGRGLNAVIASARDAAFKAGAGRLLILSADLPLIEKEDVFALLAVSPGHVAIASDRQGQGTNALSLPLPDAAPFHFQYGDGSFHAHRAEAMRLGLPFMAVERIGLAFDVDHPGDVTPHVRGLGRKRG